MRSSSESYRAPHIPRSSPDFDSFGSYWMLGRSCGHPSDCPSFVFPLRPHLASWRTSSLFPFILLLHLLSLSPFSIETNPSHRNQDMMDHFEILIRSILIRPDKPAVLLGHFSPQTHQTHGFAGADHWHNIVAQFVKSALFPDYMRDPKSVQKYSVDPVLASQSGHELISEILVAYFQSQRCTAWSVATRSSYEAVPVHTAGSEAGAGDAHGLFGGISQRPGVPEPIGSSS